MRNWSKIYPDRARPPGNEVGPPRGVYGAVDHHLQCSSGLVAMVVPSTSGVPSAMVVPSTSGVPSAMVVPSTSGVPSARLIADGRVGWRRRYRGRKHLERKYTARALPPSDLTASPNTCSRLMPLSSA
ncbi:hypothetical protein B0H19DRAFT_1097159 [Mycena capillaripes]|nr:hypothetical protein B0H19DRAFT_1203571 [Mycena capillaripes]KAJ6594931.1 hypothetical protein B0H19DRAFT_1097159 [Mycena capillaripes]